MPVQDATGPMGAGPRTGRGSGPCAVNGSDGQAPFFLGRGQGLRFRRFGRGCGMGCGMGCGFAVPVPSVGEQEAILEQQLSDIRKERKAQKNQ